MGWTKEQRNAATKRSIAKRQQLIDDYKSTGCVSCGEIDPVVLELDHRNPIEKHVRFKMKKGKVKCAGMVGLSIHDLVIELAKCDVLCANCHRRKTYAERHAHDN